MAKEKPDFVLSDGTEIHFDFSKITVAEWRSMFDREQPEEEEDKVIAKVAGLEPDKIPQLSFVEWRKLATAFFKASANPVDSDPKN